MNFTPLQKQKIKSVMGQPKMSVTDDEILKSRFSQIMGVNPLISREIMDSNGELRVRATYDTNDPFAVIRVEAPDDVGGWQNAHRHDKLVETWLVVKGLQIVIEEADGDLQMKIMLPGDTYTSRVGVAHNCWVSPGAVTLTFKESESSFAGDWIADPELDQLSKSIRVEM